MGSNPFLKLLLKDVCVARRNDGSETILIGSAHGHARARPTTKFLRANKMEAPLNRGWLAFEGQEVGFFSAGSCGKPASGNAKHQTS
jgi:hypothetical protein